MATDTVIRTHSTHPVEPICVAGNLEDVKAQMRAVERRSLSWWMQRLIVSLVVFTANMALGLLRRFFFRWGIPDDKKISHVVVYTVGIVGDNVVLLPALASLRKRWPDADITVISNCQTWSREGALGVFGNSPYVDHLAIVTDHPIQRRGFRLELVMPKLAGIRCDLFVNLSPFGNRGLIGSVVREMALARRLSAKWAVGFRLGTYNRRNRFNRIQMWFMANEPRRWMTLMKELGISPVEQGDWFSKDEVARESVITKIQKQCGTLEKPIFVINPGAKFPEKCWPADRFGAVARWLVEEHQATVVVTGVLSESALAEDVVSSFGLRSINMAGKTTLHELMELLRIADGCVTNDTGTMHLAAMAGTPTVGLFATRISPWHWFPFGRSVRAVFNPANCKCYQIEQCRDAGCLRGIGPEVVIAALENLLKTHQVVSHLEKDL